jgi:hypothetical protein
MDQAPKWLAEEPELLLLLNKVVDRFDQQPGDTRQNAILLPATKYLRSLHANDAGADRTWALLLELQRRGVATIREARRGPYDPEWHDARLAFAPEIEELLRVWLGRPPTERVMQAWRRAVEAHAHDFPVGYEALLRRRIVISGRSAEAVVGAIASLGKIQQVATLRQLSALAFWGDSKVLDDRSDLIRALFPQLEVRDRPIVVAVFVPTTPKGVLFIENQDTYTAATIGAHYGLRDFVLVYASGFRSSAVRIRHRGGSLLHFAGAGGSSNKEAFEQWWYQEPAASVERCYFWGDLDFSGMQILKTLRARFPEIDAWRPGYERMVSIVAQHGGYRSANEPENLQTDPQTIGTQFADDVLLPAIRKYGQLDQESVPEGD